MQDDVQTSGDVHSSDTNTTNNTNTESSSIGSTTITTTTEQDLYQYVVLNQSQFELLVNRMELIFFVLLAFFVLRIYEMLRSKK
jgi:hypothetical protein